MNINTLRRFAGLSHYKNYLILDLGSESIISQFRYNVLQSESNDYILPCRKVQKDDRAELVYKGDGYGRFAGSMGGLPSDEHKLMIAGLIRGLLSVYKHEYLSLDNVIMHESMLLYHPEKKKCGLVYVPVNYDRSYEEWYPELILLLESIAQKSGLDKDSGWKSFFETLKGSVVPLDKIKASLDKMTGGKDEYEGESFSDSEKGSEPGLVIRSMNLDPPLVIRVDKDLFTIGRSPSSVDGLLQGLATVSGRHCEIINRNGKHFVRDLSSTNGTYVNAERLSRGEIRVISSGDILRIADHPFIIE